MKVLTHKQLQKNRVAFRVFDKIQITLKACHAINSRFYVSVFIGLADANTSADAYIDERTTPISIELSKTPTDIATG
jgi:hypothetical protein